LFVHKAILLYFHTIVFAEGAVRSVEIFTVCSVVHQMNSEPGCSRAKRDTIGSLVHPASVVRLLLVNENGRLILDRIKNIFDTAAFNSSVFPTTEEQYWSMKTGNRTGAANGGEGLVPRIGSGLAS